MRLLPQVVLTALLVIGGSCSGDSKDGATIDDTGGPEDAEDQVAPPDSTDLPPAVDIDAVDTPNVDTPDAVDEVCKPDCAGKVCGPDGCKGACGECGPGQGCTAAGKCEVSGRASDEDCLAVEMVCNTDVGQCVECIDSEDCPSAEFCVPGEQHCKGEVAFQCDALGKEETSVADCAKEEQHCFDGQCIDGICLPGAVFCADSFNVAKCTDEGSDFAVEACPEEHNCTNGVCKPWACVPGEPHCAGHVATVCDEAGRGPEQQRGRHAAAPPRHPVGWRLPFPLVQDRLLACRRLQQHGHHRAGGRTVRSSQAEADCEITVSLTEVRLSRCDRLMSQRALCSDSDRTLRHLRRFLRRNSGSDRAGG